jgi:predicted hydrocarbon binding protein
VIEKYVIIHQYNPQKSFFEIAVKMRNTKGVLASVLTRLSSLGVNILSGYTAANEGQETGIWCSFIENNGVEESRLKSALLEVQGVVEVDVLSDVDGLIMDMLSFPLIWNTGERAVLLGQERFSKMLDRLRDSFGMAGNVMVYQEGLSVGDGLARFFVGKMGDRFVKNHLPQIFGVFSAAGVGQVEIAHYELDQLKVDLILKNSMECSGHQSKKHHSEFLRGVIAGMIEVVVGGRVKCEEIRCIAIGDDYCEFIITSR